jgi:hypothetical protein
VARICISTFGLLIGADAEEIIEHVQQDIADLVDDMDVDVTIIRRSS